MRNGGVVTAIHERLIINIKKNDCVVLGGVVRVLRLIGCISTSSRCFPGELE